MAFNKARALQEAERSLAQGKVSQAIQQYLQIIENDPSDLNLINMTGDLCVRDNSVPEALQLFRKLAEAYVREGFFLRAIAIYKKILKLDPSGVESMLKLAELYTAQ
ncbi:MAG TPA: tetratricopeptide repeat protein [Terriglobales bacterium]